MCVHAWVCVCHSLLWPNFLDHMLCWCVDPVMSSLTPTKKRVCACVHVSQVIFSEVLRATVFLDLRLTVSPVPSDTVILWRDGKETRKGGRGERSKRGKDKRGTVGIFQFPSLLPLTSQFSNIKASIWHIVKTWILFGLTLPVVQSLYLFTRCLIACKTFLCAILNAFLYLSPCFFWLFFFLLLPIHTLIKKKYKYNLIFWIWW